MLKYRTRHRLFLGSAVCFILFFGLLSFVRENASTVTTIDASVSNFLSHFETYHTIAFFLAVTQFGSIVGVVAIGCGMLYFIRHQRRNFTELVVLLSGITLSVQLVKIFVMRARPDALEWITPLHSYSFPSGHATSAIALYGFMALLVSREVRNRWARKLVFFMAIVLIPIVGFSRLILHVHYASDVFGGFLLGGAWLLLVRAVGYRPASTHQGG